MKPGCGHLMVALADLIGLTACVADPLEVAPLDRFSPRPVKIKTAL